MRMRRGEGKGALVSDEVSLTLATSNAQTLFDDKTKEETVMPAMRWIFERIELAMRSGASDDALWEMRGDADD